MKIKCVRERGPKRTFGVIYVNNLKFCESLEDADRGLEHGGTKIPKQTAIPGGRTYRVSLEDSKRFGPGTITLNDVPQFQYVRVHGGNTVDNTEGCPLVGRVRTATGIADCPTVLSQLKALVKAALARGEEVTWEVV